MSGDLIFLFIEQIAVGILILELTAVDLTLLLLYLTKSPCFLFSDHGAVCANRLCTIEQVTGRCWSQHGFPARALLNERGAQAVVS